MTISTTGNRQSYSGNGVTTAFSFPYPFFANADLVVLLVQADGSSTTLALGSDYTVSGVGVAAGGLVTTTTAPALGTQLVIYRDPAITQPIAFVDNDPLPAKSLATGFDRLTLIAQRLRDQLGRAFRLPDSDTSGASTTLPFPASNKLIGWDGTGKALQNFDPGLLATIVAYGTAQPDIFTGDGATTSFTLTANPGALGNLDVSVGGVTQLPGIDFVWASGTTLTFTTAPTAGTKILARYLKGLPQGASDTAASTFSAAGTGAVQRTGQSKLRERVSPEDFGAVGDGVADDTLALANAFAAVSVGGVVEATPCANYRITQTITIVSRHFVCRGKATVVADLNDTTRDAIVCDAVQVRVGTAQSYVPGARLEGIIVLVRSKLRDGIRIQYGDYPTLHRVDVQRDPNTAPVWRDGVHLESKGDQMFLENIDFRSVRVHDAGRDGFRFEVPAAGINVFINVGNYDNCEVRGCGQAVAGVPVRFVSNNTTATEKISSHTFTGGEFQTNHTATNPNPDGFRADQVPGGAPIENIHINGSTAECVPNYGTGLAVNTTNMIRVVLTNFLPFGFNGAPTNVGGTGDYLVLGYLGLDAYVAHGTWNISLSGATTAGAPTVAFQKGIYTRVGKMVTVAGQIQISSWGGAVGQIIIGGLPFIVRSDAFAFYSNVPSQINTVTLGTGYSCPVVRARYATSTLALVKNGSAVNDASILVADASAPFSIAFSLTYETD